MIGISFEHCSEFLFTVGFDTCILNFSSFYKRAVPKTSFKGCTLQETDFTEADLNSSDFSHADLIGAKFENSNLEKADLRLAVNYAINPALNRIKKAKFSVDGLAGLLHQYDILID
jgi:uncharacterized protein YjbI with pentapeptide repeats